MSEQKITVICAFDTARKETWYVDSREKLSRRLAAVSLAIPPVTLGNLKAMVYEDELKGQDAVVDIDGWFYSSRRARGLEKGLFAQHLFVADGPAN
jgi:hypothetical protein